MAKFERLNRMADEKTPALWPRERWSLTTEEVEQFCEVDRLLTNDEASVDAGMAIFRVLVTGRTRRLLDEALSPFPLVRAFVNDPGKPAGDASPAHDFSTAWVSPNRSRNPTCFPTRRPSELKLNPISVLHGPDVSKN